MGKHLLVVTVEEQSAWRIFLRPSLPDLRIRQGHLASIGRREAFDVLCRKRRDSPERTLANPIKHGTALGLCNSDLHLRPGFWRDRRRRTKRTFRRWRFGGA